jgi:hypothetical protein
MYLAGAATGLVGAYVERKWGVQSFVFSRLGFKKPTQPDLWREILNPYRGAEAWCGSG